MRKTGSSGDKPGLTGITRGRRGHRDRGVRGSGAPAERWGVTAHCGVLWERRKRGDWALWGATGGVAAGPCEERGGHRDLLGGSEAG